ncbi:MAG: tyrosine--tRNA ligase [bacterium]|nr:tyrosine--tRNA ligase [bacterium]
MRSQTRLKRKDGVGMPVKYSRDESILRLIGQVHSVEVKEHLEEKLRSGKKLRVKHGIDPTGPRIHIGRAISLWKLRSFQDLGHTIVLIIGDFTAQVGDPSDKLSKRPFLTKKQVVENLKGYLPQIWKILDKKKTEVRYNSTWLGKLKLQEIAKLAEIFSVQQMLARHNFKERLQKNEDISIRELFYPLMQGYDSVAVKADVEVGGADQLFNLHAGREIQKYYGQEPQDVLTTPMLVGTDGRKMSTSWSNIINITDTPNDMYGKLMAIDDAVTDEYFNLTCPHLPHSEIQEIIDALRGGSLSPKDAKMRLAREVVTLYHGFSAAEGAEKEFVRVFQKKETPQNIKEILLTGPGFVLVEFLVRENIVPSKNEAKRLMEQGGVELDGITHKDWRKSIQAGDIKDGAVLRVGKRQFFRLRKPK